MNYRIARKYGYQEYFVNDTQMRKLYNMHIKKHIWDKVLDALVLFAIILTITSVVFKYIYDLNHTVLLMINSASIFIMAIFGLELYRTYLKSKSKHDFFKNHWLDFILLVFLSFYFIFVSFLEILKVIFMDILKPFFKDAKDLRITYTAIRKPQEEEIE